jgi:aminopeptidase N
MRTHFILLACIVFLASCAQQSSTSLYSLDSGGALREAQKHLSIKHADLSFHLHPKTKSIRGLSVLTLHSTAPVTEVALDLDRVFQIDRLELNHQALEPSAYANPEGLLTIRLPQTLQGDFSITIAYEGKPREAKRAPWDGAFTWAKTSLGKDWVATSLQGEGCDLLWPCIDQPTGEPERVDLHISVPKGLVAASNGVFRGKTSSAHEDTFHWQTLYPHNTYGIALNVGPYHLLQAPHTSRFGNELDVQFFHLEESAAQAVELFAEVPPIIDFLEELIGPYPFSKEKVGFVETPFLGMEHQSINAYGNHYVKEKYGYDSLLFHEFAHEWFGNQLTNNNWTHMWLHEGFATYMEPLYTRKLMGERAFQHHLFDLRLSLRNDKPLVANNTPTVEEVYKAETGPGGDVYSKGALVLDSLRHLVGDEAFFQSVRHLVYGKTDASPDDSWPLYSDTQTFIELSEKYAQRDLDWFFKVYLYQADLPEIVLEQSDSKLTLSWQVKDNLSFPMPVEVQINGEIHTLDMKTQFSLPIKKGDHVQVDPLHKILKHDKTIKAYRDFKLKKQQANK